MKKVHILVIALLSACTIFGNSLHHYFMASYNQYAGKMDTAQSWYKKLFDSPYSTYAHKGHLSFLFDTKKYNDIITLMPSVEHLFTNDSETLIIFATALELTGATEKADDRFIALHKKFKNHYGITLKAAQGYMRKKDPTNALATLALFLDSSPTKSSYFILYYLKAQLHIQLNQFPEALTDITTCLDMQPSFDKGWLLQAQLLEQKGKLGDAIRGYYTFIELSGGNSLIEHHLAGLIARSMKMFPQTTFYKSAYDQALVLYNHGDYTRALMVLEKDILTKSIEYRTLHLQLTAKLHQYDKLISLAREWMNENKEQEKDIAKIIYLLSSSGITFAESVTILEKLYTHFPHNYWLLLYNADMHIRAKKFPQAIVLLEKALPLIGSSSLSANVCYQLSILYGETKNNEQKIAYLKKGYEYNGEHSYINNALAYEYATQKQLHEAEKHLAIALKYHPHHHCFRDTQAFVLYKQKQYEQAKTILEDLPEKHTIESRMLLAKTYYKLDNKQIALDYTKTIWPLIEHEHDKERLRKLESHLTYNDN